MRTVKGSGDWRSAEEKGPPASRVPDVRLVQVGGTESKLGRSVGCPRLPADLGACGLEAEAVPQSRRCRLKTQTATLPEAEATLAALSADRHIHPLPGPKL